MDLPYTTHDNTSSCIILHRAPGGVSRPRPCTPCTLLPLSSQAPPRIDQAQRRGKSQLCLAKKTKLRKADIGFLIKGLSFFHLNAGYLEARQQGKQTLFSNAGREEDSCTVPSFTRVTGFFPVGSKGASLLRGQ